jgi:hypothetical protein
MASLLSRFEREAEEIQDWVRHNCNVAKLNTTYRKANLDERSLLYGALVGVAFVWVVSVVTRGIRARKANNRPSTPDIEKRSPFRAQEREPGGNWHPLRSRLPFL